MKPKVTTRIAVFLIALGIGAAIPATQAAESKSDETSVVSRCATDDLLPPVRLRADGQYIDSGKCIAHSGPQLLDFDFDGKQDLLVGDFSGHIHFFKNTATNKAPIFAAGKMLEANGKPIKISNW